MSEFINHIDENKLNEFDQEVSHYVDEEFYGNYNEANAERLKIVEVEQLNMQLMDDNEQLRKKIDSYQRTNREWENKIHDIKIVLLDLEENNKNLKEENEKLKEELDNINFKIKLANEREKSYENGLKNIKEIQSEYDLQASELKKDFKNKEENIKKKFQKIEDSLNEKLKEQDIEYNETIDKLNDKIKDLNRDREKKESDVENLRQKLLQSENFFKQKESEFEELVSTKDRKLKELEYCIKSISEEANCQINKLSESVKDFNEKINYYKQREMQLTNEYISIKNNNSMNNCNLCVSSVFENNKKSEDDVTTRYQNEYIQQQDSVKNKTIEKLRSKIKELEEENLTLTRELNLKCEENETLSDELQNAYETIKENDVNTYGAIRNKEEEIRDLTNKINNLDDIIEKYGMNLTNLKNAFDQTNYQHKMDLMIKNNEMREKKEKYERIIKEVKSS